MKLGKYFDLYEFTRSTTAVRIGDLNVPDLHEVEALRALVRAVLDPLREAAGRSMRVTSGFRSERVNAAMRGSPTSQHMRGQAADVKVEGWTARELAALLVEQGLPFDQAIYYDPSRGGHLHVSYRADGKNRGELRHAVVGGGYPLEAP